MDLILKQKIGVLKGLHKFMDNLAKINFNGYRVDKIDFQINDSYGGESNVDVDLDLDFNLHVGVDENHGLSAVTLECTINRDYEKLNKPFFLDVILHGLFSFDTYEDFRKIQSLLTTNALAIIFPYMRSIISIITMNCGITPVILPTINVVEFLKHKQKRLEDNKETPDGL